MTDKFSTFAITIRPRSGISEDDIKKYCAFVKKHCSYYYIITEKEDDERHIHSAIFFKIPKTRSNVTTYLSRLFKHYDSEEKRVLNNGCKILYNNDFITSYMNKGDDTVVIERNLPEISQLEAYYPPKPEVSTAEQRRLHMHSTMISYEQYWHQYMSPIAEVNTSTVRDFLFDLQYNKRVIGLLDDKKLIQHARWFTRWYHKAESCPSSFLPPFETEEGPGIHDTRNYGN